MQLQTFTVNEMTSYFKFPRTPHLPWSPGATDDDRMLDSADHFLGTLVAVTEKLDGENCNMYSDHIHARSLDSRHHPSRTWVKRIHAQVKHLIPEEWRICGENVYAEHSIGYSSLPSYFLVFSIFNDKNICLPWDETQEWCGLLGLQPVPQLYFGPWDEEAVKACWTGTSRCGGNQEGYVVRMARDFHYDQFHSHVAKYVRKDHVQTDDHWMNREVKSNGLS